MSYTLTHTAKNLVRRLLPLPSHRTVGTLWAMLTKDQKLEVTARMMAVERPAPDDVEAQREYAKTVAEMAYDLLRVRMEIEGGLEIA